MAFREYPNSPSPRASTTGSRPGVAARNRACAPGIGFATLSAFTALWFNERHWDNTGFAMTLFGIAFIAVRFSAPNFPTVTAAPRSQPFHYW